jgi:hypothetical protein
VSFPVAVYNYLDTAQTVRVEMLAADWFTPLGGTGMDIDLGPGQVTGVRFPVRVDKVGRQTMTVKGTGGGTVSDAVARSVLVVPDGQAVPVATSGALGAGTITNTANFPAAAVAGSQQLYLNVYPAYHQILENIRPADGFSAVHGCLLRGPHLGRRGSSAHGAGASSANQTLLPRRSAIRTGSGTEEPLK